MCFLVHCCTAGSLSFGLFLFAVSQLAEAYQACHKGDRVQAFYHIRNIEPNPRENFWPARIAKAADEHGFYIVDWDDEDMNFRKVHGFYVHLQGTGEPCGTEIVPTCQELNFCGQAVGELGNNVIQLQNFVYDALRGGFDFVNLKDAPSSLHQIFDFGPYHRLQIRCNGTACAQRAMQRTTFYTKCNVTNSCPRIYKPDCQKQFFGYACHKILVEERLWISQYLLMPLLRHYLCVSACASGSCDWLGNDTLVVHLRSELCDIQGHWQSDGSIIFPNSCLWLMHVDKNMVGTLTGKEIDGIPYPSPPCSYLHDIANHGNGGSAFARVLIIANYRIDSTSHPCASELNRIKGDVTLRTNGGYLEDVCTLQRAQNLALTSGTFGSAMAHLSASVRRIYVPFYDQAELPAFAQAHPGRSVASYRNGGMQAFQVVAGAKHASKKLDGLFNREQFLYKFPGFCEDDYLASSSTHASFECIRNYPQSKIEKSEMVVSGWMWSDLKTLQIDPNLTRASSEENWPHAEL